MAVCLWCNDPAISRRSVIKARQNANEIKIKATSVTGRRVESVDTGATLQPKHMHSHSHPHPHRLTSNIKKRVQRTAVQWLGWCTVKYRILYFVNQNNKQFWKGWKENDIKICARYGETRITKNRALNMPIATAQPNIQCVVTCLMWSKMLQTGSCMWMGRTKVWGEQA